MEQIYDALTTSTVPPIFDGAAVFTVLAVVMALAAYLRLVAVAWQDLINKIQGNDSTAPFPWKKAQEPYQRAEREFIETLRGKLAKVTAWLFIALGVTSVRILFYVALPNDRWPGVVRVIKDGLDFIICLFIFILVIVMSVIHYHGRKKEAKLRQAAAANQRPEHIET